MKISKSMLTVGILLLTTSVLFSGCKKKFPAPEFSITYNSVVLQTGDAGIDFFASCTTTDVYMTKVEILDPNHSATTTYNLLGVRHNKDEIFALQDPGSPYLKVGGVYQITFIGNRTADNEGFSAVSTINVAK